MDQGKRFGGKLSGIGGRYMLRNLLAISAVLLAVVSVSIASLQPNIQAGNWEITTSMKMPGMKMGMEPARYTQCLSRRDPVPRSSQEAEELLMDGKIL